MSQGSRIHRCSCGFAMQSNNVYPSRKCPKCGQCYWTTTETY